ncbi:MAG: acyltransferase domain-containing protein [Candidatus Thiodiazotropha sp.]
MSVQSKVDEQSLFQPLKHRRESATVFMYSGQGSQYYHMARELYEKDSQFKSDLHMLDLIFSRLIGTSVLDAIYDKRFTKDIPFTRMLYTHSAIYMIEYCLTKLLNRQNIYADYYLGASLGEFSAMSLAANTAPQDVIQMLVSQSQLCESQLSKGGMLAVFGPADIRDLLLSYSPSLELAADNFNNHFVVCGDGIALQAAKEFLNKYKILNQEVAVSFAYHSSQFDSLKHKFKNCLFDREVHFHTPCISCSKRKILRSGYPGLTWEVIRKPINFAETFSNFAKRGEFQFIDLGPSGTLSIFAKNIIASQNLHSNHHSILTPYGSDVDNLSKLYEHYEFRMSSGDNK